MVQRTTATLVQAPTRTRQAVCVTISVWLQKATTALLGIDEVSTVVKVKPGESKAQTFKLCHAQVR